jgi:hypothetical protein
MGIGVLGGTGNPLVHAQKRAAMESKCSREKEVVPTLLPDVEGDGALGPPMQRDTQSAQNRNVKVGMQY